MIIEEEDGSNEELFVPETMEEASDEDKSYGRVPVSHVLRV